MKTVNHIKNTSNTITKLVILSMMLFLSGFGMSAQNINTVVENTTCTVALTANDDNATTTESMVSENSNMNLFSWFMGTKQTPNANLSGDSANNVKKQIINSGIEPNRILIKTFLKKATIYTEAMA